MAGAKCGRWSKAAKAYRQPITPVPAHGRPRVAIGTVSAVNADSYDDDGNPIPQIYHGATRAERHQELIRYAIDGATTQVKKALRAVGRQKVRSTSTCCGKWRGAGRARRGAGITPAAW